jgi:hypothetical protein
MRGLIRQIVAGVRRTWVTARYRLKIFQVQRGQVGPQAHVERGNARAYWRKHLGVNISTRWHTAYARATGNDDVRFVPEDVYYTIIEPALTAGQLWRAYVDKNVYAKLFPPENLAQAVLHCIHRRFYAFDYTSTRPDGLFDEEATYFIKPSLVSGGATKVEVLTLRNGVPHVGGRPSTWDKLVVEYAGNFVVERAVVQHPDIAAVHPSSVNTLRITTLNLDEPRVLSSVLRCGIGGSHVDNLSAGGIACGVQPDGSFNDVATHSGVPVPVHPDTGFVFAGAKVPGIADAHRLVCDLHRRLYYFDLASWDVAIDPQSKAVLIEVNLRGQSINIHQMNNGPLFGDLTEEVLHLVRNRKPVF